jgi:predicted component of type VI protein secretion system
MLVVLKTLSVNAPGRLVQLRSDQVLKVGSSGWADFSVDGDSSMKEEHFEVRCAPDGCYVRVLSPDAVIYVNGEEVSSATAFDGDEIRAGATTFQIAIQGGPPRQSPQESVPEPEEEVQVPFVATAAATAASLGLVGICAYLEFDDDVKSLAKVDPSADKLIGTLSDQEKYQDALRLRAYTLEKRQAVWWGCYCCRSELDGSLPLDQAEAVDAAVKWVTDPSESCRRGAETQAAKLNYAGPGATLALSAFWSEGSLAPEGSPEVEADERLTSQGVTAALVTAAYLGEPTKAADRFKAFLSRGQDISEGKIPLPGET